MPPTGVGWSATLSPSPLTTEAEKTFCLIFSAATSRLTLLHTRHRLPLAQNPTAACPLDIPYLLRGQGTTLLLVLPTTPCHTLTGLPRGKEGAGIQATGKLPLHTVKPITCFFDPTHTSGWVSPLQAVTGVWSVSSEVSQQVSALSLT